MSGVPRGAYYELVELLGEGGMGRVHRAIHHPSGTPVAIKTLRAEARTDALRRRLMLEEATAAAKVDHPSVVRLLDLGREEDGTPFLVMELATGFALDRWLETWPGWPRFCAAIVQVLEGLAAAHAVGVVHCDLKPPNVIVDAASGHARILDFGVATMLDPLRGLASDRVAGTPELMPPEQLAGHGPIGPWTDLYALGVILAYGVRGGSPFREVDDLHGLLAQKLDRSRERARPVRAGMRVPEDLQVLIDRLLAPHPRARPRFAAEVIDELRALAARVEDESARATDPDPLPAPIHAVNTMPPDLPGERTRFDRDEHTDRVERISGERVSSEPGERRSSPGPGTVLPANESGIDGALGLRDVPLVGRDDERIELEATVEEVIRERTPRLFALVGEAGIGKSRLASWGMALVERKGLMEGAAGGYDASGVDVAGGLRHALRRLLGGASKGAWTWLPDEPGLDRAALEAFLRADEGHATLAAERVVQLAHATLRAASRVRPIYLWLDDLGWAGDGALALVRRLLDERGELPVLIVATLRTTERVRELLAHRRARARTLERFARDERAALLDGVVPLAPGVAHGLAERLDGTPMLLVQLVRDQVASGLLVPTDDGWAPRPGMGITQVLGARPLRGLVGDRLDAFVASFGADARAAEGVLVRAALLGARFELGALRAACARDPRLSGALQPVLDRALLGGMVRAEQGAVYAFDNALLHEALVARAEGGRHAMIDAANGLQSRYGKERADIAALVAGLLRRAGDRDRAWERQLRAIDRAAWASDDEAARRHLATAELWAETEPLARAQVAFAEGRVHYFALRYEASLAAFLRAKALAEAAGDRVLALRCHGSEADLAFYQGRFAESARIAERVAEAASHDDPDLAALGSSATQRLADVAALAGDFEAAERWRREAIAYAESAGAAWRARVARLNLAELLTSLGRTAEARALADEVRADARSARDDDALGAARECEARIAVAEGRGPEVREWLADRVLELETVHDGWRLAGLAPIAALAEDEDEALERGARRALDAFRAVPNDEALTMWALGALAERLRERGRTALADELATLRAERIALARDALRR